jgi:anti-sigma factor RsiW
MSCRHEQTSISALVDGELSEEAARELEARIEACADCRELLASFREMGPTLSNALKTEPDPGFLVRFRSRRDELSVAPWWTWRQLAMRLLPLTVAALAAAVAVVWVSLSQPGDFRELEVAAIGDPGAFVPAQANAPESVLSIALEPFPEEIP